MGPVAMQRAEVARLGDPHFRGLPQTVAWFIQNISRYNGAVISQAIARNELRVGTQMRGYASKRPKHGMLRILDVSRMGLPKVVGVAWLPPIGLLLSPVY